MKAMITKKGGLLVQPETELEAYALTKWMSDWSLALMGEDEGVSHGAIPIFTCSLEDDAPTI